MIYTARDAAHKRLCELVAQGKELPLEIKDATIYYVGPTPARPGEAIGSAGPTTSYRMDAYSPTLIALGETGMIGKGKRGPEVVAAMKEHGAVYFGAIGGLRRQKTIDEYLMFLDSYEGSTLAEKARRMLIVNGTKEKDIDLFLEIMEK